MRNLMYCTIVFISLMLASCAHTKKTELEQVAKDWCKVIRASQVIPVYPLTEDLQPGDVFLVQVPIDQQQSAYEAKGFLPLDNMVARIDPKGYADFYKQSFEVGGDQKELPRIWLQPGTNTAWSAAPDAAFPSYNFTVRRGAGFSLALPVQGVPIGLSLLGSDAANGSITISDAITYGVDTNSLYRDVIDWAANNPKFLANYASSESKNNYLRVVNRVYLTGKLNVSLEDAGTTSAAASAGTPKPVNLLVPTTDPDTAKVTLEKYSENIEKLNQMISKALETKAVGIDQALLPGGTVKVAAASGRSITLVEQFARPLVVGYLGFDMLIDSDGRLGPPIPTHAVLVEGLKPIRAEFTETQREIRKLLNQVDVADDPESIRLKIVDKLAGEVQTIYNMYVKSDASSSRRADVFKRLIVLYLADESGGGPRHDRLKAALEEALQ